MITLKKVDEDSIYKVINMKLPEDQHFVAPNVYSLAQAWLYPEARPFAIYNDDEVVGFMMLDWDEEGRDLGIWRFMIAQELQHKGYGRQALNWVINMAKESKKFDTINLDVEPENVVGKHLYKSMGFNETGEIEEGEEVMLLKL